MHSSIWDWIKKRIDHESALIRGSKHPWVVLFILVIILGLFSFGFVAYLHLFKGMVWADWTGFGEYTGSLTKDQRGKTLWDWLELLVIPAVIGLVGAFINHVEAIRVEKQRQNENEREQKSREIGKERDERIIEIDRLKALDQLLENEWQAYMRDVYILIEKGLLDSSMHSSIQQYARARTLTSLRRLDGVRKGLLLNFLYENDLIVKKTYTQIENALFVDKVIPQAVVFLHGADFSNSELPAAVLNGANLINVNFSSSKFINSYFIKSALIDSNFEESVLTGAYFSHAYISKGNFSRSKLEKTDFTEARLNEAIFTGAILKGANLRRAYLFGADLRGADLRNACLEKAILFHSEVDSSTQMDPKWILVWRICNGGVEGEDLIGVDLEEVTLSMRVNDYGSDGNALNFFSAVIRKCNMERANLSSSVLNYVSFVYTNLQDANLRGCELKNANFMEADLRNADLSYSNLENANFPGSWLEGSKIENTQLDYKWRLVWEIVNNGGEAKILCNQDLLWANLCNANMKKADLSGADLRYSNLTGCDLSGANLEGADLFAAVISESTKIDEKWIKEWDRNTSNGGKVTLSRKDISNING